MIVSERPREGWSVVNEQGETVALDLELTDELRRAGLAREVVRLVQEARKSSGFEVSDRIELVWQAEGELPRRCAEHADADRARRCSRPRSSAGEPDGDAAATTTSALAIQPFSVSAASDAGRTTAGPV